ILVSRISCGLTIREIVILVSIVASVISHFWFTILGGSGIFYELINFGSVSARLLEDGLPAAIISIANQLPLGSLLVIFILDLSLMFVVTTANFLSFTICLAVKS